jgi:hypothetical protein
LKKSEKNENKLIFYLAKLEFYSIIEFKDLYKEKITGELHEVRVY